MQIWITCLDQDQNEIGNKIMNKIYFPLTVLIHRIIMRDEIINTCRTTGCAFPGGER